MNTQPATLEADLRAPPRSLDVAADPIAGALRRQGHTSISTGLRTAQVDGLLYTLSPEGEAAIISWLRGQPPEPRVVRLTRRSISASAR